MREAGKAGRSGEDATGERGGSDVGGGWEWEAGKVNAGTTKAMTNRFTDACLQTLK